MNFGIIGGGMIAQFHAQAITAMDSGSLHSVYIRNPEKAARFAADHHCVAYSDLEKFLADPALEIVTIATPSGAHLEPALAAAKAKKHIICEKPLEVTVERVDQMISAAQSAGVTLAGIFNRRFHPAMEQFKQAVDKGRLGQLTLCEASVKWYRDQDYYDSGAWRGTWKLDGGGALMNQSIHAIDQLLYLAGPVKRVSASIACLAHHSIEVEDTAVAILEFENGARGVIQGSTACWSCTGHPAEIQLCGDLGSVFLSDESFRVWDFQTPTGQDIEVLDLLICDSPSETAQGLGANDPSAIHFSGHQQNFEDVVKSIQNGTTPSTSGEESRKAVALICAIYQSAKNDGQWVTLF